MRLVDSNPSATVTGADELPGKSNYFIGNDPKKWRTNVPTFAKVKYRDVYPGVDLVYYGNQGGQLEYDFVVAPGADPNLIKLDVGAVREPPYVAAGLPRHPDVIAVREPPTVAAVSDRRSAVGTPPLQERVSRPLGTPLQIATNGDLVIKTGGGEVRFHKPVIYQRECTANRQSAIGNRQFLGGHYTLDAQNHVRFQVAPYDQSRALFIDPVLTYSTYLGGSGNNNAGQGIAVDGSGNTYVVGITDSADFPTVNPLPGMTPGRYNAFVTKINTAGSALIYSTYLGGGGPGGAGSGGNGIAIDASGNAYVTGSTFEHNFPTVNPIPSPEGLKEIGLSSAFVSKLDAAGSSLVYSTYLAGDGDDFGLGVAVDSSGDATVVGATSSGADPGRFPTVNALQPYSVAVAEAKSRTAFVAKLATSGSTLVYSTYLGGSNYEYAYGVADDISGNAYVTGVTSSIDFPTVNPLQPSNQGGQNAFVAKLNPTGSALVYSTYLGGSGNGGGSSIAVDSSGDGYVTGTTDSTDFPTTANSFQPATNNTYTAGFIAKLNATGSALVYSTYLHGTEGLVGEVDPLGIALDASGNAYLTGFTCSTDFPTVDPIQATNNTLPNNCTGFVAELNIAGSALVYSTYLGGTGTDGGNGIAVDSSGNAYVAGETTSTDFPTTPGAFQTTIAGGSAAFISKISPASGVPVVGLSPTSLTFGPLPLNSTSAPQTITLTNNGGASLSISSVVPSGDFTITDNTCVATILAGSNCTFGVTFTPTVAGNRSGTITVTDNASGSPQTVSLTGTGLQGTMSLSTTNLSFGNQVLNTTSGVRSVTVTNTGTGPLNVTSVAASPEYARNSMCASTLNPGDACTVGVTFTPTALGAQTGTVTLNSNASNGPQVVNLTGNGFAGAALSCSNCVVGGFVVGSGGGEKIITLANAQNVALTNLSISITGSSDYSQTNTCGTALGARQTCAITVTFTPSIVGVDNSTLTVADSAANSPQTATLLGAGLPSVAQAARSASN